MTADVTSLLAGATPATLDLARGLLLPTLGIAVVSILLRVSRRVPVRLQCWIWWVACFQLLWALLPVPELTLRIPAISAAAGGVAGSLHAAGSAGWSPGAMPGAVVPIAAPASPDAPDAMARLWPGALLFVWALGVLAGVGLLLAQRLAVSRVLARATPWDAAASDVDLPKFSRRLGLSRVPRVLSSPAVRVPQLIGCLDPRIVVPAGFFDALAPAEKEMALCHELVHAGRRDLLWGWIPTLAVRIFWFHPLAWLAAREYAIAREAACDLLVLDLTRQPPRNYGRLLLQFARTPRAGLVETAGAALSASPLKRRLLLLSERDHRPRPAFAWAALVVLASLGLLPLRLTGEAEAGRNGNDSSHTQTIIVDGDADAFESKVPLFVFSRDRGRQTTSMGSMSDADRVLERIRDIDADEIIWFEFDGRSYAILDPETLARAHALFAVVERIGDQQSEIGDQQSALGDEQSRIGDRQSGIGDEQSRIAEEQSRIMYEMAERNGRNRSTEDLQRRLEELSAATADLSAGMEALGAKQEELGAMQDKLGRMQDELGRLQDRESKKLRAKLVEFLEAAIRSERAKVQE